MSDGSGIPVMNSYVRALVEKEKSSYEVEDEDEDGRPNCAKV